MLIGHVALGAHAIDDNLADRQAPESILNTPTFIETIAYEDIAFGIVVALLCLCLIIKIIESIALIYKLTYKHFALSIEIEHCTVGFCYPRSKSCFASQLYQTFKDYVFIHKGQLIYKDVNLKRLDGETIQARLVTEKPEYATFRERIDQEEK